MRYSMMGLMLGLVLAGGGPAWPSSLQATFSGTLLEDPTPFSATFFYDASTLPALPSDPTTFAGSDPSDYAVLTTGGLSLVFDGSDQFYLNDAGSPGMPTTFGVRDTDGSFLYLKLTDAVSEGDYQLASVTDPDDPGEVVQLTPETLVTTAEPGGVAPVPLPAGAPLFAAGILILGGLRLRPSGACLAAALRLLTPPRSRVRPH